MHLALTPANYHSTEANNQYMSKHQFDSWCECPARTKAELDGNWNEKDKPHFVIGSAVDMALLTPDDWPLFVQQNADNLFNEPTVAEIKAWCEENERFVPPKAKKAELMHMYPECRSAGKPNSNMITARRCIARAQADPVFMEYLQGNHQEILTAKMYDCDEIEWKAMFDVRVPGVRITDLKTAASMMSEGWIPQWDIWKRLANRRGLHPTVKWQKGPWYEMFNYFRQAVVYMDIEKEHSGRDVPFFLAPVSKESYGREEQCDIGPILEIGSHIEHLRRRIKHERGYIRKHLPQVLEWKFGREKAPRCEGDKCGYCASTRTAVVEPCVSHLFID